MTDYDPQAGREMPADPGLGTPRSSIDYDELQAGLAGLAVMVAGAEEIETVLAQVATYATHAIPGATGAGVTLLRENGDTTQIESFGATADFVREIDRIQYELLGEGPCITSMQTRRPSVSGALGSDRRWTRFGGRVARLGVHSALSLPLTVGDTVIGAINSYAHERDAFTEHSVTVAERFCGPAAVTVRNAQLLAAASARAEQLQRALTSRAVIDQAIGIVLSRTGGTPQEVLERLKKVSQNENVKLAVIAQRLVDEAIRSAHARHS